MAQNRNIPAGCIFNTTTLLVSPITSHCELFANSRGIRYNSVIIPTVAVNSSAYIVVSTNFLDGGAWNTSRTMQHQLAQFSDRNVTYLLQSWHGLNLESTVQSMQLNARNTTHYNQIPKLDCVLTYSSLFGNRSDMIMVSSAKPENNNALLVYGIASNGTWDVGHDLCDGRGKFDCARMINWPRARQEEAIRDWNVGGYKVDYCLSSQRSSENLCSVEYSFSILVSKLRAPKENPLSHVQGCTD